MTDAPRSGISVKGPVTRRLLGLFIICSVVPTTWFALFTEGRVTQSLMEEADRSLATAAKWQGAQLFARLTTISERAQNRLGELSLEALESDVTLKALDPLRGHFRAFAIVAPQSTRILAGDSIPTPTLTQGQLDHLRSGRELLYEDRTHEAEGSSFILVHPLAPDRWLLGALRQEAVWGPNAVPIGPHRVDVFSVLGPISESATDQDLELSQIASWGIGDLEPLEWELEGETLRGSLWTLPLEFTFGCEPWTVVASTNREKILAPVEGYRSTFYRLVAITTLAVALLALGLIRRQVKPLTVILDGTRRVARGELSTRIELERRDEFGVLAHDFNSMAEELEQHFHTNATVRAVTEAILGASELDTVIERLLRDLPRLLPEASIQVLIDTPIGLERHRLPAGIEGVKPLTDIVILEDEHRAKLLEMHESWIEIAGEHAWLERVVHRHEDEGTAWFFPMAVTGKFLGGITIGDQLELGQRQFVRQIANQGAIALSNTRLIASLESMSWETLCVLARTVDAKSPWTAGHSDRVAHIARKLASSMGLSDVDQERIFRGALLHDVGKVGTPIELLDKAGPLTAPEYELIQEHVLIGCRILGSVETFLPLVPMVRSHHERFDGNGYPDGLAGQDIPLDARLVSIADAYDAMVSDRPYRTALGAEESLRRIRAGSGSQFDPACVEALLHLMSANPDALVLSEEKG